ncbi:MAG TPA: hypothetical protein VFB01_07305 [Burkholderiales bacterium]|jgi:hypothetical protein|nr:hypothetical protein [Burkholderiales bacterium]
MSVSASTKKPASGKRAYRRQDLERRRTERKWFDPAMKRENHARRPGQGHGVAEER